MIPQLTDEQRSIGLTWVERLKMDVARSKAGDTKRLKRERWLNRLAIKANQLPDRHQSELHQPLPDTLEDALQ